MNGTLRILLGKVYSISERKFVWVNIVLAGIVVLAHGGALAVTYAKPTPDASEIRQVAIISVPIAATIILTAVAALIFVQLRPRVLALHGIALAVGASTLLLWALSILFNGVPEGRFVWSVGFLTVAVCYATVLFCRFTIPSRLRSSWGVYYAPIFALACGASVDVGVSILVKAI